MRTDVVRDAFIVVMVACGGAFDAASYLRLHAFTANMTGNTVLLALAFGGRHFSDVANNVGAIGGFALGALLGSLLGREATNEDPWPARVLQSFAFEIALVVAVAVLWTAPFAGGRSILLLILGSAAMGVQSGITHDIHRAGASSTYMTGTLARSMEYLADVLRFRPRGRFVLNATSWLTYLLAATGVAVLDARGGDLRIVFAIVAAVLTVVAIAGRTTVKGAA